MRMTTESARAHCPYCGEPLELVLDLSVDEQEYVEDCFVCCRPMVVQVWSFDGEPVVSLRAEDEV